MASQRRSFSLEVGLEGVFQKAKVCFKEGTARAPLYEKPQVVLHGWTIGRVCERWHWEVGASLWNSLNASQEVWVSFCSQWSCCRSLNREEIFAHLEASRTLFGRRWDQGRDQWEDCHASSGKKNWARNLKAVEIVKRTNLRGIWDEISQSEMWGCREKQCSLVTPRILAWGLCGDFVHTVRLQQ